MKKILWLCYFSNAEVQSFLPVWKKNNEFGPWIPNILKGFENNDDIKSYVISPQEYLIKETKIILRKIHYYFIPFGVPLLHRHWPSYFRMDVFTKFYLFRKKVVRIVKKIKPDLIILSGAENALYSSSILDYKGKYSVLVIIQGFIHHYRGRIKYLTYLRARIQTEKTILKQFKYFCGELDSSRLISEYNPSHKFFKFYFPTNEKIISSIKNCGKKYDCIFVGRLVKNKGAEDFIKVVAELKKKKTSIKGCIIGSGNINQLINLASKLKCKNNIDFIGYLNSQQYVFEYIKSSKVLLIPSHIDRLPSTIRESMLLKTPIVSYATGGIPYINKYDENIVLVETGNVKNMAERAFALINDDNISEVLVEKAYKYAAKEYSLKLNTERIINACRYISKRKG